MKRSTVALATLPMFALTALISASAQAATKTAAKTGAKPKPVVPAPGKSCAASNVGIPVAGEGSVLLDCIKTGTRYVWQVSKSALGTTTLAPTTTAAVAAAVPATTVAKSDKWPDKIVFAPVPSENSSIALATWSPFVKALEYASGQTAVICGKPSAEFYHAALASLGDWAVQTPGDVLMVGDDIWGDIQGAQDAGLKACLVKTGKYREEVFARSGVKPDLLISDIGQIGAGMGLELELVLTLLL